MNEEEKKKVEKILGEKQKNIDNIIKEQEDLKKRLRKQTNQSQIDELIKKIKKESKTKECFDEER